MSNVNSIITDESKNIAEDLYNEKEMDISSESIESDTDLNEQLTINNEIVNDDQLNNISDQISETNDSVNNKIIINAIVLPDSPKEIGEVFKGYNNIQKKNKEVINSFGNEVTKKIEELRESTKIEEIESSKKKNRWLWWWPW
jgi:hypothetical protein